MSAFVVPLESGAAKNVQVTGGKGAALARLVEASFRVPSGFCVTTAAYRTLTDTPDIQTAIESIEKLDPGDREAIAERSGSLRAKIRQREPPEKIRAAIVDGLDELPADAYAVRSSATAEDLPTASFAGQHETFLGVRDRDAVLERIRDCLASLFTERAVSYRLRNGISHSAVAMAVVVQEMVEPDAAGVLFTADPVSGNRHVASVDANFGLGDTVVAGDVSPDNARVDRRTGSILEYEIGEKRHALRSRTDEHGGTEAVALPWERRESRTLTDAQLRALVGLGERIERLLDGPQDIEWALVDGEFVLLQARPITSLFPLPSPLPTDGRLHVYLSFGHAQAMPEALPPLVVDLLREFLEGGAEMFRPADAQATRRAADRTDRWAVEAGGRIYLDLTPLLRFGPLRRIVPGRVEAVNEPAADGLRELLSHRRDAFTDRGSLAGVRTLVDAIRDGAPVLSSVLPRILGRTGADLLFGPPDPGLGRDVGRGDGRRDTRTRHALRARSGRLRACRLR